MSKKNKNKNNTSVNKPLENVKKKVEESKAQQASTQKVEDNSKPKIEEPEEAVVVIDPKKETTTMIDEILNTPMDAQFQQLDQNGRLRYAELIERVYINPRTKREDPYVKAIGDSMTRVFHATMVSIALRESIFGKNEYSIALNAYAYPQIQEIAKQIGYNLPEPSMIKKMSKAELKKLGITMTDTQLSLEFKDENASKELKKKLEEEGYSKVPELDVNKIDGNTKLKAALEYLMNKPDDKGNITKSILATVSWMKQYRYAEAEKLKDAEKAKEALDKRSFTDWLDDITKIASPTILFLAVGSQYKQFILEDKNPIRAFLSMKSQINGGSSESEKLSDEDIAALLSMIVSWIVGYTIEKNNKYLSGKNGKLTKEQKAAYEQSNVDCDNVIKYMTDCEESSIENIKTVPSNKEGSSASDKACYFWIRSKYFGNQIKDTKGKSPEEVYENCEFNIQQQAGVICNYFRSESNKLNQYSLSNISKLVRKNTETKEEPAKK